MKNILTYTEFMNEGKIKTSYYLKDKTRVLRINYKGQSLWINPRKGDTQVFVYKSMFTDDNKADLEKPMKDDKGKTVMLKIEDLYGLKEYPGEGRI